jgi:phosphoribosylformylglycinamidine synthase
MLYFGPLDTPKNLYLFEHIIEGIAGYGNCIGVPVVRGETYFDESYSGNPLVNVVCVGLAREENIVTACAQKAGNKLVLIGSTTGKKLKQKTVPVYRSVTHSPKNLRSKQPWKL